MRIAQFSESYRPVINGVAVAVDSIASELGRSHRFEVFAPHFPGHVDDLPEGTAAIHRFPSWVWPAQKDYPIAYPLAPDLWRRFREAQWDVVHTHSPFTLGQVGLRWARRLAVPVVTTYHTLYVNYAHYAGGLPPGVVSRFLQRLSRDYCNGCDGVAVPTAPIRDVLLEYGVRTPIRVIPTGVRLAGPVPEDPDFPRRALGIPEQAPLVLYAGRLAREKNLDLLFAAFARVAAAVPDCRLLVCGDGPEEPAARRAAAGTGAAERIHFAGFVPPERMGLVYASAQVFAFTSLTDTQGLVLTEAKAAGLPAVSVAAYGPAEVVRDGVDGLLSPNDPDAFAAALARLLTDRDLRGRMSAAALAESERYSLRATAAAYEELYAEARDRARSRVR